MSGDNINLFQDGDWYIYQYSKNTTGMCLRHTACKDKAGVCACTGFCDRCKAVPPDKIRGFFKLVKWKVT